MRRIRIFGEYLFAFLLVSTLLLAIFSTVAVKFYGDELQSKVIRVINSKIDTKLYAEQINISIFRRFPSASVVLRDVTIWSSHNFNSREFNEISTDTLLYAETIYLHFNMLDLLKKKYSIKQFEARNGCIRIFTDTKGEGNYRFLKTSEEKPEQDISFVLNELNLLNFQYMVDNRLKKLGVTGSIYELKLNGKFYRRDFQLKTQSHFDIGELNSKGILFAENRDVKTRINLDVTDSLFQITKGSVQFDKIIAETSGNFILSGDGGLNLDISTEAKDINMNSLIKIIPNSLNTQGLTGQGKIDLVASFRGKFSSSSKPFINADLFTKNASISGEFFPFQISKLNLSGNYNNGSDRNLLTSSLTIHEFSGEIDKELLQGSFSLNNFSKPRFHIKVNGNIDPAPWVNYFDPPVIAGANGKILSELDVKGFFNRQDKDKYPLQELVVHGDLTFANFGITFKNNLLPLEKLSGKVTIQNDVWKPSLTGIYGNSDFTIEGIGLNFTSSVLNSGEPIIVSGDVFAEHIDLHEIVKSIPLKSGDNDQGLQFPENLNIRCNYFITHLEKDHFTSENLKGTIIYDPPLLIIDSLSMRTMGGTLGGNIAMAQDRKGDIYTNITAELNNLDIQNLFYSFNNFGQDQITADNLRGIVAGTSEFAAVFSRHFQINTQSIINTSEIMVRNGELNNFEPIRALSKFIDIEELQKLHFATLRNTILIRDNQVIIPRMDIQSNALDLSASGIHSFDKTYDYRISLLLSELLYQKARKNQSLEYVEAKDEYDKRTLFMKIYNNGQGVQVEYDREQAVKKIREDLKKEKSELKQLINEEFGLHRKDREIKDKTVSGSNENESALFKFEFGDDLNTDTIRENPGAEKDKIWFRRRK